MILKAVLGVDLGIKNIAADSSGEEFSGKKIEKVRTKMANFKADLQSKGTKSALNAILRSFPAMKHDSDVILTIASPKSLS